MPESDVAKVIAFGNRLTSATSQKTEETSAWICRILLEDLAARAGEQQLPAGVSRQTQLHVRRALEASRTAGAAEELEQLLLKSQTPWDIYLRGLTPDLPTFVSDWLSDRVGQVDSMPALWEEIRKRVDAIELDAIRQFCFREGKGLMDPGTDFQLPDYIRAASLRH